MPSIVRATAKGSKGSLGVVDALHFVVEARLRTVLLDLEKKLGKKLDPKHRLMPWLVRHIGWTLTRCQLKAHGKTAFEVIRGKPYEAQVERFASVCLFKEFDKSHAKLESRWTKAIYVGKAERTDEHLGITPTGTIKSRSVQAVAEENLYDFVFLETCRGLPWNPREEAHKEHLNARPLLAPGQMRSMYITKTMVSQHGPTPG